MRVMGSLPRSALATESARGNARLALAGAVSSAVHSVLFIAPGCVLPLCLFPLWPGRTVPLIFTSMLGAVGRIQAREAASPGRLSLSAAAGPDLLPHLQDKLEVCHLHIGTENVFLRQLS